MQPSGTQKRKGAQYNILRAFIGDRNLWLLLMHVFPELLFQQDGYHEEHQQEQHHIDAYTLAFKLHWLCDMHQEGCEVAGQVVIFLG